MEDPPNDPSTDPSEPTSIERKIPVLLKTKTTYQIPTDTFMIPVNWKRYHLSQLINKVLNLSTAVPFDLIINGDLLAESIGRWCGENGIGEEETVEIEYIPSALPPELISSIPQPDWVTSVSLARKGLILSSSYDSNIRILNQTQQVLYTISGHTGPVSSACWIPTSSSSSSSSSASSLIASASYDTTARIFSVPSSFSPTSTSTSMDIDLDIDIDTNPHSNSSIKPKTLATLHLHSAALSSISANASGSHLITAGWDKLLGLWTTDIPLEDELPAPSSFLSSLEPSRKRRKTAGNGNGNGVNEDAGGINNGNGKRKAPANVLKSHTARVSKALFVPADDGRAFSVGWDCALRSWDLEVGLCTNTTISPERVMLDLAITSDSKTAIVASADRQVLLYSIDSLESNPRPILFPHSSAPTALAAHPTSPYHFLSACQDGVVRVWDTRTSKIALATFKGYDDKEGDGDGGVGVTGVGVRRKVLSLDWAVVGAAAGGEEEDGSSGEGAGVGLGGLAAAGGESGIVLSRVAVNL